LSAIPHQRTSEQGVLQQALSVCSF